MEFFRQRINFLFCIFAYRCKELVKLVGQDFGVFRIGFLGDRLFRDAATDGFPKAVGIVLVASYLTRNKIPAIPISCLTSRLKFL